MSETSDKVWTCQHDGCSKQYQSRHSLRSHENVKHAEVMEKCSECDQEFLRPQQLEAHIKRAHVEADKRKHQCDLCDKNYLSKYHLQRHKRATHFGLRHKCDFCSKVYMGEGGLKAHVNAVHVDKKSYTCSQCDKSFSWQISLANHVSIHHNSDPDRLEKLRTERCNICDAGFRSKAQLSKHTKTTHSEKLYRCTVETCTENFSSHSYKELESHRNIYHPKKRVTFKCDHCHKPYFSKTGLNRHVSREHDGNAQKFPCDLCDRTFCEQSYLKMHIKRDHEGLVESFTCNLCPKSLATRNGLRSHMKSVHEKKRFECGDCGKSYTVKKGLQEHINLIHLNIENHVCSHCNMAFLCKSSLKGHIKQLHGEKEEYKCEEQNCEASFTWKPSLRDHMTRVHGANPDRGWFQCDQCDRKYVLLGSLNQHKKFSHAEKTEQCPDCPWKFRNQYSLKLHYKVVHLGQKPPKSVTCDICDRKYESQGRLKRHKKASHSERTVQCPDCPKKFATKGQLKVHHKVVHLGQKPAKIHKCDFCDYRTDSKSYMERIHKKKHLRPKKS